MIHWHAMIKIRDQVKTTLVHSLDCHKWFHYLNTVNIDKILQEELGLFLVSYLKQEIKSKLWLVSFVMPSGKQIIEIWGSHGVDDDERWMMMVFYASRQLCFSKMLVSTYKSTA